MTRSVKSLAEREGWQEIYHTTQNIVHFKSLQLFVTVTFHFIYLDYSWPQVTETEERDLLDRKGDNSTMIHIAEE